MPAYTTPADVRPLLGNIGSQRTDEQIQLAINAATDEINRKTDRIPPKDWQETDPEFDLVKKIARYQAALEMTIGIKDFEDREFMNREVDRMFKVILDHATTASDFVESSEPTSWPANPTGEIWSVRFPRLRKSSGKGENSQYSINWDIG